METPPAKRMSCVSKSCTQGRASPAHVGLKLHAHDVSGDKTVTACVFGAIPMDSRWCG